MKPVFAGLGCVALAMGVIGIFLPLLPTTPFLLLAAFLFARSSERLHTYLITHPYLGAYIRNYHEHTMTRAHKVRTLTLMWAGILISAALINKTVTWIILPLIACGVTVHIWRLRGTVD